MNCVTHRQNEYECYRKGLNARENITPTTKQINKQTNSNFIYICRLFEYRYSDTIEGLT